MSAPLAVRQALVQRLSAGPGDDDLQWARVVMAPFVNRAIGAAHFPIATLLGAEDAVLLCDGALHIPIFRGLDTTTVLLAAPPPQHVHDTVEGVASQALVAFGGFVKTIFDMLMPGIVILFDSIQLRGMPNGARSFYVQNPGNLDMHSDNVWFRMVMHVAGVHAGVRYIGPGEQVIQLQVGEVVLLSGWRRPGVKPTRHAAPNTDEPRCVAIYDFLVAGSAG